MDVLLSHQRVAPKDETREAQKRTQEAQEIHFCASGVLFLCFLCFSLRPSRSLSEGRLLEIPPGRRFGEGALYAAPIVNLPAFELV